MKKIEKWWGEKCVSIRNYREDWKKNGNKPRIDFFHNGGKRKNGDKCFDATLIIGYVIFNYTNFDLQNRIRKGNKVK